MLGGLLCLCGAARAQERDSRMERIIHPDMSRGFDLSIQKKFGSNAFDSKTSKVIELKSIPESRKYDIKSFLTGQFHGDKSFWMGDFKFSAKEANTKSPYLFKLPEKSYGTKPMEVKSVTGLDKHFEAGSVPTRDFRGKERDKLNTHLTPEQAANNGFRGELRELKSIDDVRDLLNKSK